MEAIYLQFRNVLELIATASLSVNIDANKLLEGKRKWHAGDILAAVEMVNPNYYYPRPVRLIEKNKGALQVGVEGYRGEFKDFKGDYLTREKFTTLYSVSSKMIHTPNPFDKKSIIRNAKTDSNHLQQSKKWLKRIIALVTHHKFMLAGEEDMLYICHTVGPNANFKITPFKRMAGVDVNSTLEEISKMRAKMLKSSG